MTLDIDGGAPPAVPLLPLFWMACDGCRHPDIAPVGTGRVLDIAPVGHLNKVQEPIANGLPYLARSLYDRLVRVWYTLYASHKGVPCALNPRGAP